jgi:hypothetical protein
MDLDKKLKSLPKELLTEVESYVDFLIFKHEKAKAVIEPKPEKKTAPKAEAAPEEPPVVPVPPPVKEHKVLGLFNSSGPSNTVSTILANLPSSSKPATEIPKPITAGWDTPKPSSKPSAISPPKTEMLGEREIETERKLYPCPYCQKVVQDNWEICPYCDKSLKEPVNPPLKKSKKS